MAVAISESSWKAFVKKQKLAVELDDKELLKALARFDKSDERKPEPRLDALKELTKEIPRQVTALLKLKKQLGDKPFGVVKDELYAILEEAEALQKKTQAAAVAEDDEDKGEEEDEDSAASALVNPKLLLKQLTLCRKDPDRTMKFAFVDAKGKDQPAMLAMHPRLSARKLFGKLQAAAGVKTGAYGSAWVDGTSLMLQLDKPLSGLVKKVRGPVKSCGFRITKAVLWDADGTVFEQESEEGEAGTSGPGVSGNGAAAGGASAARASGAGPAATAAPNAGNGSVGAGTDAAFVKRSPQETKALSDAFKDRLKAVLALTREMGETPAAEQAKQLCVDAGMYAGKRDWERADELMRRAEGLFSGGKATTAVAADGSSSAAGVETSGDLATDWKTKLAAWTPAIKAAMMAKGPTASDMAKLYVQATSLSKPGGDLALALAKLTECHGLALAAAAAPTSGSRPAGAGAAAPATGQQAPADRKSAMSRWEAQQSLLAAKLNGELAWIKKVAKDRDPKNASLGDELLKAELEMTAVMRRVRGPVRTPEQAAEMEHFLKDDDVVSALCDYTGFDVRPVVAALQQLQSSAA